MSESQTPFTGDIPNDMIGKRDNPLGSDKGADFNPPSGIAGANPPSQEELAKAMEDLNTPPKETFDPPKEETEEKSEEVTGIEKVSDTDLRTYQALENPGLQLTVIDEGGTRHRIIFEKGFYQTTDPVIIKHLDEKYKAFKQKGILPIYEPSDIRKARILKEPVIINVDGDLYEITPEAISALVKYNMAKHLGPVTPKGGPKIG